MSSVNIKEYVEQYERSHPPRPSRIPTDPSKKWWFSKSNDRVEECIERCQYSLFQTALEESGMTTVSEPLTQDQRIIHARFSALQPKCVDLCTQSQY